MNQTTAADYADAILWRGRIPMEPSPFTPDWTDRPRKWKHYRGAESLPLPEGEMAPAGTVAAALSRPRPSGAFTLATLGGMLRDTYGLLGRRLAIQANTDLAVLPSYAKANWHRGAASGGGLYPVSIYWVAGAGAPVLPGIYHYAPHQHALRPLLAGDVTAEIRSALPASQDTQFLVLGVKYWQNAFKYNSFCFHAVSMDAGAAAQALRTWARSVGLEADAEWFFDEGRIARLLGVDDREGIFAVVPLGGAAAPQASPTGTTGTARVRRQEAERSRHVFAFPSVQRMQAATRQDLPGRPDAGVLSDAAVRAAPPAAASVVLPEPAALDLPLTRALRRRRSSFGRFDARTPLPASALATSLAAAAGAAEDTLGVGGLLGLYVYVNHVDGLAPGTYQYDASGAPHQACLRLFDEEPPGSFLQRTYFLANYNLEQAGAVVVPTMRTPAVLDAVGQRGYRLVNATIGAVAQNVYLAGAALDVGCGVALGFDNVSFVEQLGLPDGEFPLLLMMLGADRPGSADFRYELVR